MHGHQLDRVRTYELTPQGGERRDRSHRAAAEPTDSAATITAPAVERIRDQVARLRGNEQGQRDRNDHGGGRDARRGDCHRIGSATALRWADASAPGRDHVLGIESQEQEIADRGEGEPGSRRHRRRDASRRPAAEGWQSTAASTRA